MSDSWIWTLQHDYYTECTMSCPLCDCAEANLLSSVIINHMCSPSSPSVSQECGCVCLRWLSALHGVGGVSARQFVAGHLCHAGQGDRHHRVRSVRVVRRPGALPQASHLVSTQCFCFVYVLFILFFFSYLDLCGNGLLSMHTLLGFIFTQLKSFPLGSCPLQPCSLFWRWRVFFWNRVHK